ncbi:MAG: hypothetical protein LJF04_13185 [Gemmatimonadetes bacterium]|nr:hypothetical protein [Gemmatimonadota bacterium]
MSLRGLSQTRQRAWLATVIWSVAGMGFVLTFFTSGGVGGFPEDSGRHLTGAFALAFGFLGQWLAWWITRQREGGPLAADERDIETIARANQTTLVVVLVAIFAFTITLWTVYESAGSVPVAWMWFLAYGGVILASVTSSVATLILDRRTGGHG